MSARRLGICTGRYGQAMVLGALLLAGIPPRDAGAQDELRIAAVVNDEAISARDLDSRLRLVMVTSGIPDTRQERQRISLQVLRNLIDERLQLQEAKRLNIAVTEQDLTDAVHRIEGSNNMAADSFESMLADRGLDKNAVMTQLRASVAWTKVVRQQLTPSVQVGEDEVDEVIANIERSQNLPEYNIAEILLPVDEPRREDEVRQSAQQLAEQIRGGGNFSAVARQMSAAASAAIGGEVGWILEDQIEPVIMQALHDMKPGEVSNPIRTLNGFQIVQLRDQRTILAAQPDDAVVRLTQVLLPVEASSGPEAVEAKSKEVEAIAQQAKSCEDMDRLAEAAKSPAPSALGRFKIGELNPGLRAVVADLKPGKVSPAVRMPTGVAVLMVCERSAASSNAPSRDDVHEQLFRGKLSVIVRRYMRDLRRGAFLDVRG
ncbi:MAG: peptidylprolyl isomerase [Proteobacteria bacterium]|nr:peptidylprolyl isomerase [Pseudomonadota bacterium]MBI3495794.1 peptidylprolyl isomerase [Pseudomonadota bacterium]